MHQSQEVILSQEPHILINNSNIFHGKHLGFKSFHFYLLN